MKFRILLSLFFLVFVFSIDAFSSNQQLRPLVDFLDQQQLKLTEAYAEATNSPACVPMSKEEKKALANSFPKCAPSNLQSQLTEEELDDLFFHQKSLDYKEVLDCKKRNIDCFISNKKELGRVADFFVTTELYYMSLIQKLVNGKLNSENKAMLERIFPEKKVAEIIPREKICSLRNQFFLFFKDKDQYRNLKEESDPKVCFREVAPLLQLTSIEGASSRQLEDFIGGTNLATIAEEVLSQSIDGRCQAKEFIKKKLLDGVVFQRNEYDKEENKVARSCILSEESQKCFYKPTYLSKHYLMNIGQPNRINEASIKDVDSKLMEKFYCHLNRKYGLSYDELSTSIEDHIIPIFDLVLYYRAIAGKFLSLAIAENPSAALTLAQMSKSKLINNSVTRSATKITKTVGNKILIAGALIQADRISKSCLSQMRNYVGNSANLRWDTNHCSCNNQHEAPIKYESVKDCQEEILKILIEDSLAPLAAVKDSLFMVNSVKEEGYPQAFEMMFSKKFSRGSSWLKSFTSEESSLKMENFIKQYMEDLKASCP